MRDEPGLLQGTLDVLILRALVHGPRHGHAVARWIHEATDEALRVEDRALYIALHRAHERGWVSATWGPSENNRRARFYALTKSGRRALARQTRQWRCRERSRAHRPPATARRAAVGSGRDRRRDPRSPPAPCRGPRPPGDGTGRSTSSGTWKRRSGRCTPSTRGSSIEPPPRSSGGGP